MARKYTAADRKQAVMLIVGMMIDGMLSAEIWKNIEKSYDVTERTFFNWRKRAEAEFVKLSEFESKAELGKAISRLNNLYNRAIKKRSVNSALNIQRELNELLGLKTIHIKEDKTIEIITSIPTAKEE